MVRLRKSQEGGTGWTLFRICLKGQTSQKLLLHDHSCPNAETCTRLQQQCIIKQSFRLTHLIDLGAKKLQLTMYRCRLSGTHKHQLINMITLVIFEFNVVLYVYYCYSSLVLQQVLQGVSLGLVVRTKRLQCVSCGILLDSIQRLSSPALMYIYIGAHRPQPV